MPASTQVAPQIDTTQQTDDSPVLIQVAVKRFGNSRRGNIGEIKTGADKKLLRLTKRLLDCAEFQAVAKHDWETVAMVRSRSIPSLFKSGVYQMKPQFVPEMDQYLRDRSVERAGLVTALMEVYRQRVAEAAEKLGPQFRDMDYPSEQAFAATFGMEWRFFTLGPPEKLRGLDPEFVRREADRLKDLFARAREEGLALVRAEFAGLVDHLVDRLTPDTDGKRKKFTASSVANITQFLADFEAKDVANDAELGGLVMRARQLLAGADPEKIRESLVQRDELKNGFEAMKKQIDGLVVKAPSRFVDVAGLQEEGA